MKDILVNNRYRVDHRIGEGGFSLVYEGTDTRTGEKVALKLTNIRDDSRLYDPEAEVYEALSGGTGIPQVRWTGTECDFSVVVCDLLGPSLADLLNYCGRRLSLKTILLVADQAISRLKFIHSKGYLHNDIRPENILMGAGKQGNTVYIVDFGLAEEHGTCYAKSKPDTPPAPREFNGNADYSSNNYHNGYRLSWGDDLESLGYVLIYLARGSLPWGAMQAATRAERARVMRDTKASLSGEELCKDILPTEFATYINYCRSLSAGEKPDYNYLQGMFRRLFRTRGYKYDNVFDWTEKRFIELYGDAGLGAPPISTES